jgi:hypothetical protein
MPPLGDEDARGDNSDDEDDDVDDHEWPAGPTRCYSHPGPSNPDSRIILLLTVAYIYYYYYY